MIYLSLGVLLVFAIACVGLKSTSREAYETAAYEVLRSDGPFEIREYPALTMATTSMRDTRNDGDSGSFSRLFGYITGANDQQQKVAMTTPVFMEREGQTAAGQMGFVIPKVVAQQRVPSPSRDDVEIRQREGGRFAVIRFAGRMNRDTSTAAEERLRAWVKDNQLHISGDVEIAGYDPPWTPGPLRRNEILLRLSSD